MTLALRPLVVGDRVAHREDHDWSVRSGEVVGVDGDDVLVRWLDVTEPQAHDRADLVAGDDADAAGYYAGLTMGDLTPGARVVTDVVFLCLD
jgi:hypothetical protein